MLESPFRPHRTPPSWLRASLLLAAGLVALPPARAQPAAGPVPLGDLAGATYRARELDEVTDWWGRGLGFRGVTDRRTGTRRFGIGADQFVEFLPGGVKGFVVRFEGVTLTAPDLRAVSAALAARGVAAQRSPRTLSFRDPFGHPITVAQAPRARPAASRLAPGFSQRLQYVALVVHHNDEELAQRFYGETLGLHEVGRVNDKGGRPRFIRYRLPGARGDELQIFFVWGPLGVKAAGEAFHLGFAVDDIERAYCTLFHSGVADEDRHFPTVNAEQRWTMELHDPEHTRVVIQAPGTAAEAIGATKNLPCSGPSEELKLFDGKSLKGWSGEAGYWRVEDGMIVGESKMYMHYNTFLWHDTAVLKDFYLSVWIKQTPSRDRNSGVQFRSHKIDGGNHAIGYQADVGTGLWGRLYHEEGRQHLYRTDVGEKAVDWDGWNHYEILAVGHRIWTAVNGTISVRVEDPIGELTGKLSLQIHFDPPQLTRFRDLKVIRNPPLRLAGLEGEALLGLLEPVKEEAGIGGRKPSAPPAPGAPAR